MRLCGHAFNETHPRTTTLLRRISLQEGTKSTLALPESLMKENRRLKPMRNICRNRQTGMLWPVYALCVNDVFWRTFRLTTARM